MEPKMIIKQCCFVLILGLTLLMSGCEEPFVPETEVSAQEIVVEGYIEAGPGANPTYVIISKSIPFISTVNADKFAELFIKGASVSVNDGNKDVQLSELCLSNLPDNIKAEVYRTLGFEPDSSAIDICIYVDILDQLKREVGRTYKLTVMAEGKQLSALTTIPPYVGLFDFKWSEPPGEPSDSLAELNVKISDPAGVTNYYRYLTGSAGGPLIPPFTSVTDDAIFDGKEFEFPLQRAERRDGDFDPESFGLFTRGDSIIIKWTCIDKSHFDFWNTRDFSANSGGPFSSYTRIASNIKGGLGVWGGYSVDTYRMRVPPK